MFISGILQWDALALPWQGYALAQAIHILFCIIVALVFIIPFSLSHINKHKKRVKKSSKSLYLAAALFFILASGTYLFFIGNRGGDVLGSSSYYIHLYGSFILMILLFAHTKKIKLMTLFILFLPSLSHAEGSSSALYVSKDKAYVFSANLDGGSVSKVDIKNRKVIFESQVGIDIRSIAANSDESLFCVSDYEKNQIVFLDKKGTIKSSLDVKYKPYGVVFDAKNNHFIVTLFESSRLLVLDAKSQKIIKTIKTLETPRGLAITNDGKLLITHAMIGVLSIYDSATFTLIKTIKLDVSHNDDKFVSQGEPRLLDEIAITPDGKEAWLPHVLWSFDHSFQFQSTVFPAISIISLDTLEERIDERKQLFKSINIQNSKNETMIVSNPHSIAFSKDGSKAFVTMASSEDIVVFNLGRSVKENSKRHRKKALVSGGGAKATEIFRAYPDGTNPRAIVLVEDELFVQNGATLDLSRVDSGGNNPFATLSLKDRSFIKLLKSDPLAKNIREGKNLFNNGNSNFNKNYPMSGDFWMSCNSCHLDGFNSTNRYLFLDTKLDKFKKATIGHENISHFLTKTTLADFIKIARDTQGGMGADEKAGIVKIDESNPPQELKIQMQNLLDYVKTKNNLRYLSTWVKLEEDTESYHKDDWTSSVKCKSCHSDIFDQWNNSNHKNMVGTNPYYMVLEDLAAKMEGEEFRKWCMGCHNPTSLTVGLGKTTPDMKNFTNPHALMQNLKDSKLEEGVSCVVCHRITKIENALGNASYTLAVQNREKYIFEDNSLGVRDWLSSRFINSKPNAHKQSYMKNIYKDSRYCASCHDEFSPSNASEIVSTFKEWEASDYNNPQDGKSCIDCHMTQLKDGKFTPLKGYSTTGGALKNDIKVHYFAGSNHFLASLRNKDNEEQILQLLRSAAKLDISIKDTVLEVGVKNVGAGHHLPTGVADFRELWLEVKVVDKRGKIVFESGKLKNDGNLEDGTRVFMKVFGDKESNKVGLAFWRYEKMISDTRIRAGERRVESFDIGKDLSYPLKVDVKLNFRIYPQWVTDIIKQTYPDLLDPTIVEIAKLESEIK